jgi:beta-mannosidase
VSLAFTDEGLAGLRAHVVNDRGTALTGEVVVRSYRGGETVVDEARAPFGVAPHGAVSISVPALLDGFRDQTYAYRFGPPGADLVVGSLVVGGATIAQAFFFPTGRPAQRRGLAELGLEASVVAVGPEEWDLVVRARRFAFAVAAVPQPAALLVSDSYFHVAPGDERGVRVTVPAGFASAARAPFTLALRPTNADGELRVTLPPPPE